MATGTPSREYAFVVISEDDTAYRSKEDAERGLKRKWAPQAPGERVGYFIAKIVSYFEPEYDFEVHETPMDGKTTGKVEKGKGAGTRSRASKTAAPSA
jgi:hypothetical protein